MDTNAQTLQRSAGNRRRRYSRAYKRRVVEESLAEGASVSVIARRHDVNANQLFKWRKLYREGLLTEMAGANAALVPVELAQASVSEPYQPQHARQPQASEGEVEIALSGGHRLIVRGVADREALRVALEVLGR